MSQQRVLVVGAGAVGQVFAHHYQRGGAAVTLLVRARHRAEAERGFVLYPLDRRGIRAVRFDDGMSVEGPQPVAVAPAA